jgi:hypothetical protein
MGKFSFAAGIDTLSVRNYCARASIGIDFNSERNIMKYLIFCTLAAMFAGQTGLSATGFVDGDAYNTVTISGKVHMTCDYENGSGWADHDCNMKILRPTSSSGFHIDGVTHATRLELTVHHVDGSVVNAESGMNLRTGTSDVDFNLWSTSGRFDQPLLATGNNVVNFKLMLRDGRIEREGVFSVGVDTSSARVFTCRSGRMASDNSWDCYSPPPRYVCSQYFRYENFCGAGSSFE